MGLRTGLMKATLFDFDGVLAFDKSGRLSIWQTHKLAFLLKT